MDGILPLPVARSTSHGGAIFGNRLALDVLLYVAERKLKAAYMLGIMNSQWMSLMAHGVYLAAGTVASLIIVSSSLQLLRLGKPPGRTQYKKFESRCDTAVRPVSG